MNKLSDPKKGPYLASVSANRRIGARFYRLKLSFQGQASESFAKTQPGQFAQLDLSKAALPAIDAIPQDLIDCSQRKILLRRPFSFAEINTENGQTSIDILYCVLGPATLRMTTLKQGDSISVIGPLGNGFSIPESKKTALLIAGGMGAGPLLHLAQFLSTNHPDIETIAFTGAKTAEDLPFEKPLDKISQTLDFSLAEFAKLGINSFISTDDGSAGSKGFVTECFSSWLEEKRLSTNDTIIYACGPEPMLAKIAEISQQKNIDCQVSMERMMACGIGLCQSCAVECKKENSNETVYKLCCKDGPVFNTKEVIFGKNNL